MATLRGCALPFRKIFVIELRTDLVRMPVAISISILRKLLREIAVTVTVWHFALALGSCNFGLIKMKEKIGKRHSIELQQNSRNAEIAQKRDEYGLFHDGSNNKGARATMPRRTRNRVHSRVFSYQYFLRFGIS